MKVISLGWGVQSFTLTSMVALGELEPVDAAIHADTLHESQLTYEFAKRWTPWLESRGVKAVTVSGDTPVIITRKGGENLYPRLFRHAIIRWRAVAPTMYAAMENRSHAQMVTGQSQWRVSRTMDRHQPGRVSADEGQRCQIHYQSLAAD